MHWNTYNPIYIGEFDSFDRSDNFDEPAYRIMYTISKKNYSGPITSLYCAGTPLVHRWLSDDPIPPIKGSEVEIKFLNKDHLMPLGNFYSEEDDTFKIKVDRVLGTLHQTLFEGYLVQEDCTEVLVDHTHELSLVFTDNLGLLKNVRLDAGSKLVAVSEPYFRHYVTNVEKRTDYFQMLPQLDPDLDPKIGDTMILEDDGGDIIYTVLQVRYTGSGIGARVRVWVDLPLPAVADGTVFDSVWFVTPHDINQRISLGNLLKICLQNTGMLLDAHFGNFLQVKPTVGVFTSNLLDNVFVDCKTFKSGDQYDTLYEVIEKILARFTATLFQARGIWKMERWLDMTYGNNGQIMGRLYNPYFVHQYTLPSTRVLEYGNFSDIETGANETIVRPLKYVRHQFNFEQPTDMLFNYKLDYLGEFDSEFTFTEGSETFTVKRYEALGWLQNLPSPFYYNPRYIDVVYDSNGVEKDRKITVTFNPLNGTVPAPPYINHRFAGSTAMEVNKGDVIRFSFDWKGENPGGSGPWYLDFLPLALSTTTQEYRIATNGEWVIANDSFQWKIEAGTDFNEWQTISVETKPLPSDGLLTVWLWNRNGYSTNQEFYKNFNFEYVPYMGGRSDVKAQAHKAELPNKIKNVIEEEIFVDQVIKNYPKGALFLGTYTNGIMDLANRWSHIGIEAPLGQLISKDLNLWRHFQRSKIELRMWPLVKFEDMLSMDCAIKYLHKLGHFYIFGKLEIDYKRNDARATIYEIFNDVDAENNSEGTNRDSRLNYEFKYLFK